MSGDLRFLDASAFLKLLLNEPESAELERWRVGRRLASSDLLRTEARRGVAHMEAFVLHPRHQGSGVLAASFSVRDGRKHRRRGRH